jgi:hypothetical protein
MARNVLSIVMPFEDAEDLRTALRAAQLIAAFEIQKHNLRPLYELHRMGLIRYRWPEVCRAPGVPGACERFLSPLQALAEGGEVDCDDVAPWRAGELQLQGQPAAAVPVKEPAIGWHCVVDRGRDGTEDPSRVVGMR